MESLFLSVGGASPSNPSSNEGLNAAKVPAGARLAADSAFGQTDGKTLF
jgi:hypothetical protein